MTKISDVDLTSKGKSGTSLMKNPNNPEIPSSYQIDESDKDSAEIIGIIDAQTGKFHFYH